MAIDAARSIWRLGSEVTVVYRRSKADMPANKDEIIEAEAEGIKFRFMSGPNRIIGDKNGRVKELEIMKMKSGGFDSSGRKKPVPSGETAVIPCDTIILAVGEKVDSEALKEAGINFSKWGTLEADQFSFQTTNPKIYVGGDAVTGPATAAEAMGMAKKAAEVIDFNLTGQKRFDKLFRQFTYQNTVSLKPEGGRRNYGKKFSVKERGGNFQEVSQGYNGEQARLEATRCLRCDVKEFE